MRIVVLAGALLASVCHSAPSASISDLAWMSGEWSSRVGGYSTEVHYSTPGGGMILGTIRALHGDGVSFFELERIVEESGTLVLYPYPEGVPGVSFALKELTPRGAVFENPTHDFPRTVSFSADRPDELHIRVEGEQGGQSVAQEIVVRL